MDWVQLSQGHTGTTRRQFTFYHPVPRFPGAPGTQLIDLGRIKAELALEPPSGFERGTPGLEIQRLNH